MMTSLIDGFAVIGAALTAALVFLLLKNMSRPARRRWWERLK